MSADIVRDNRVRHAVLPELPGRQTHALVAWAGRVNPHMNRHAPMVRLVNRRQRGPPADGCKPAAVAAAQHTKVTALGAFVQGLPQQTKAAAGDRWIDANVTVVDFGGGTIDNFYAVAAWDIVTTSAQPVECPA